jgi:hypothetical protein
LYTHGDNYQDIPGQQPSTGLPQDHSTTGGHHQATATPPSSSPTSNGRPWSSQGGRPSTGPLPSTSRTTTTNKDHQHRRTCHGGQQSKTTHSARA